MDLLLFWVVNNRTYPIWIIANRDGVLWEDSPSRTGASTAILITTRSSGSWNYLDAILTSPCGRPPRLMMWIGVATNRWVKGPVVAPIQRGYHL